MSVDLLANPRVKTERGASLESRVSALENYIALLIGTDDVSSTLELAGTVKIGGRLCSTVASAINAVGELTASNFNTSSKQILSDFTFGASGAIKMITDVNNGLWLSPGGILGKKAGATTFSIDTSGNATFGGTLVAASGTFGTITAGSLAGITMTGGTIRTATSGARVQLDSSNYFQAYDASGLRMKLDTTTLHFYDSNQVESGYIYANAGVNVWAGNDLNLNFTRIFNGGRFLGTNIELSGYLDLAGNISFLSTQYIKWGASSQYTFRHDGADFSFNDGITAAGSLKSTTGSVDQLSTAGRVRQYLCGLRSRSEPGNPAAGEVYIYYNSSNNNLEVKFSDGNIFILANN